MPLRILIPGHQGFAASLFVLVLVLCPSLNFVVAQEPLRAFDSAPAMRPIGEITFPLTQPLEFTFPDWQPPFVVSRPGIDLTRDLFSLEELKLFSKGPLAIFSPRSPNAPNGPANQAPSLTCLPLEDPNEFGQRLVNPEMLAPMDEPEKIALTAFKAPDQSAFGGLAFIAVAPHLRQELLKTEPGEEGGEDEASSDEDEKNVFKISAEGLSKIVQAKKKELLALESEDNEHAESLKLLTLTEEALLKFDADQSLKRKFETETADFDRDIENLRQQLNNVSQPQVPITAFTAESDSNEDKHDAVVILVSVLQSALQEKQQKSQDYKSKLESIEDQIQIRSDRVTAIPAERAAAIERREDVRSQLQILKQQAIGGELGTEMQLRLWLSRAKTLQANIEVEKLDAELKWQKPAGKKLPLERDLKTRQIKAIDSEIASWELAVANSRRREVELQAAIASDAAVNAHPKLSVLADYNKELTKRRSAVNERVQFWTTQLSRAEDQFDTVNNRLKSLKDEIKEGEITAINGLLLKDSRQSMIQPGESYNQIYMAQRELRSVNATLLELKNERERLADPTELIKTTLGFDFERERLDPNTEEGILANQLRNLAMGFVEDRVKYLDSLLGDYDLYRSGLKKVKVKRATLVEEISTLRTYIDEKALWIRSAEPVSLTDLKQSSEAIKTIFCAEEWAPLVHGVKKRVASKPYESAFGVMGLFALFVFSRRFKEKKPK